MLWIDDEGIFAVFLINYYFLSVELETSVKVAEAGQDIDSRRFGKVESG